MTKLLLVEDDNNLREIYEARLSAEGYEIITAKDGEEALEVAKKNKPELIISDVMMPRISGFEMLDILRNTDGLRNTKIIMLTALGQAEDKTRADSLGADRYLVKSQVTLEDIVKAADELLNPDAANEEQPPITSAPEAAPGPQAQPAEPSVAPMAEPAQQAVPITPQSDVPTTQPAPQPTPVTDTPTTAPTPTESTPQAVPSQAIPVTDAPNDAAPQPQPTVVAPAPEPADEQKDAIINAAINDLSGGVESVQPQPAATNNRSNDTDTQGPKQKVISPISPSPEESAKPDLATLLAQEEASGNNPTGQTPPASSQPAHQPNTVFKPNDNGNSNDVAL